MTSRRRVGAAGLTARQVEILRLVVSTRTVDHHVAAVLRKLGVRSRRDAAAALAGLDLDDPRS